MVVNAAAGILLVTLGLLAGTAPLVQGSRNLLQSDAAANLFISVPVGIGFGNTPAVEIGTTTAYVFLVTNEGNAPAPTVTATLTVNDLFTFSKPYAGPPEFRLSISPNGHSVTAFYNKSLPAGEEINFQFSLTATTIGPQAVPFGLTGSAQPGGAPFRASTPAVTKPSTGVCGSPGPAFYFPTRCWYNNDALGRYVCCDSQGCDGFNADNLTPHCKNAGYVLPTPPPPPPTGDQGVCGSGPAQYFPTRCWFNSDPLERYVCCDIQGCDGFNADNLTPHCKNAGFVPNLGVPSEPSGPPSGDQGECGSGAAQYFPNRCWYNNDPQHRYVCCDNQGCDGFNADNLTPHCKNAGFIPATL